MKINIVKREIPEAISEEGGAYLQFVDKQTVDLETSIQEAKNGLYVIGDTNLIKGYFSGLMKSVIDGISRDGLARQLGEYLTIYPVVKGEFDLEKGWDESVNSVAIKARLLNEMSIDITDWEFVDVTEGRVPFSIESVTSDATTGVVKPGYTVELNGKSLPATADLRVEWTVSETGESGQIAAGKFTSTCTRCDLAPDALETLHREAYDGKTIVFTLRGNKAKSTIKATLEYVDTTPVITSAKGTGADGKAQYIENETITITGRNLTADKYWAAQCMVDFFPLTDIVVNADKTVLTAKADLRRVGGNSCVIGQKTAEGVEEWIALSTLDMVES